MLLPKEVGLLRLLKKYNIGINEFEFEEEKLAQVQDQLEMLVDKNFYLQEAAKDAYKSYLHAYVSHKMKDVYNINDLDLAKVCKSFGFTKPPLTSINIRITPSSIRRNREKSTKKEQYYRNNNSNKKDGVQYTY